MLLFVLLALFQIVTSQTNGLTSDDPCLLNQCQIGTICVKRSVKEYVCLDEKLLNELINQKISQPQKVSSSAARLTNILVPTQRMINAKQTQVPVVPAAPVATTPVVSPVNTNKAPVRKGSFIPSAKSSSVVASDKLPIKSVAPQPLVPARPLTPLTAPARPLTPQTAPVRPLTPKTNVPTVPVSNVNVPPKQLKASGRNFLNVQQRFRIDSDDVSPQPQPQPLPPSPPTDNTFSTRDLCRGFTNGESITHPFDNSKFIVCNPSGSGIIMSCPPTLRFNTHRNRCDYTSAPPQKACLSNPCQNGGKCIDTDNFGYVCQCPREVSGDNCEKGFDFCVANPGICGPTGICQSFGFTSPDVQYVCLCENSQRYGLDCAGNSAQNPCLNPDHDIFYPVHFSDSVFLHCEDQTINFKACNKDLIWVQEIHGCDRRD